MATVVTLTINVADILGVDYNPAKTAVYVEANTPNSVIIVDGAEVRIGGRRENVGTDGTVVLANLVATNTADNPTSFEYRVTFVFTPKGARAQQTLTTSTFPLTASANLAAIDEAWDDITAPPSWRSDFRDEMEALRDQVQDISSISTSDDVMAAVAADTGSDFYAVQSVTIATAQGDVGFSPATLITDTTVGADPEPLASIGGYLYGWTTNSLYRRSSALGGSWTLVGSLGGVGGTFVGMRATGDGEVLVFRNAAVFRSTGWTANPLTATWSNVLAANGSSYFVPFSFDVDPGSGWAVATSYGPGESRYLWKSVNNGATWSIIRDIDTVFPTWAATSHTHFATLDPYADPVTPRIFFSFHDTLDPEAFQRVECSDDGGSTWTTISDDWQPTVCVAAAGGVAFATDDLENGIQRLARMDSPANMVGKLEFAHTLVRDFATQLGWGSASTRDIAGNYHIGWTQPPPGIGVPVLSTNGVAADEIYNIAAADASDVIATHQIVAHGDVLLVVYQHSTGGSTVRRVLALTRPTRGIGTSTRGGTIPGTAGPQAVADGYGSVAELRGVARGVNAQAGEDSVAIGYGADATTDQSIAIGTGATSQAGVAVGHGATATGAGTALGYDATTVNGLAIGYGSTASGANTAMGYTASAQASESTAVGQGAVVASGHVKSMALGAGAVTTQDFQTHIGGANGTHFQVAALGFDALNGPANHGRWWFQIIGGKMKMCVRFPTGATQIVATEP